MDINDSFQSENIEAAGIALSEEELMELSTLIEEVINQRYQALGQRMTDSFSVLAATKDIAIEVSGLAFVSGRTYEDQFNNLHEETFPVYMKRSTASLFMEFLAERAGL